MKLWILLIYSVLLCGCGESISLSATEKDYIDSTAVKVALEKNYTPYIFTDNNDIDRGITIDYLNLISKKTGIKFIVSTRCSIQECFDSIVDNAADLVTTVRSTSARSGISQFTRPYFIADGVIVQSVLSPKTVGIGRGFAISIFLKKYRPDLEVIEFNDNESAIIALIAGSVDSVVLDQYSAHTLRAKLKFNFDERGIPYDYPFSFAVSKDNEVLQSILNKAIASISDAEHSRILNRWK